MSAISSMARSERKKNADVAPTYAYTAAGSLRTVRALADLRNHLSGARGVRAPDADRTQCARVRYSGSHGRRRHPSHWRLYDRQFDIEQCKQCLWRPTEYRMIKKPCGHCLPRFENRIPRRTAKERARVQAAATVRLERRHCTPARSGHCAHRGWRRSELPGCSMVLKSHLRDLSPAPSKRAPACASLRPTSAWHRAFISWARSLARLALDG
jgi:hypothetical protein